MTVFLSIVIAVAQLSARAHKPPSSVAATDRVELVSTCEETLEGP
jgi:hypothetical protein